MGLFKLFRLGFYAVFLTALAIGYYVYVQALSKPLQNRHLDLEVPTGVGVSWLANHLENEGVIGNKYVLRAYIWMNQRDVTIKAGEYTLLDVDSIPGLVDKLAAGRVKQYALTLIEGKTFKEYRALLSSQKKLEDELAGMTVRDIMRAVGSPGKHPEGMFAPQTYFYQRGDSDLDVLKQAHDRQQATLEAAWAQRSDDLMLETPYQLLIMASIIEKETGAPIERPEISGVFNNRLRIGMKLQTDPTVIYGMGDAYDGNIRRRDLRTDTEYNTYTRYGLPPTPIANPGEAAIFAAAQPQKTDALYFVGKGDGTHYFSKNLREHNEAVIKYQLGGKRKSFSSNPGGK
ncbi:MAG: endolytic transglycosylase MltG [Gammaproteobacteria bacterium]|nr:endolytic transglycosylase MltG [Gammaproteobacteria bacterium]